MIVISVKTIGTVAFTVHSIHFSCQRNMAPGAQAARWVQFFSFLSNLELIIWLASIIKFSIQYASVGSSFAHLLEWWHVGLITVKALLYYDYSLTWTREVKYFWRRKFTLSTALYIACRYALVANVIYTLAISNRLKTLRVGNLNSQILTRSWPLLRP